MTETSTKVVEKPKAISPAMAAAEKKLLAEEAEVLSAEVQSRVIGLNKSQKEYFYRILNHVKKYFLREPTDEQFAQRLFDDQQLRIFINGKQETGKTHLLKVLASALDNMFPVRRNAYYKDLNDNEYITPTVLLASPTGASAHRIDGNTLCALFYLPHESAKLEVIEEKPTMNPLDKETLEEFREKYRNLKFLLIDGLSIYNFKTLYFLDARLKEIFNNKELFGGINLLFFGSLPKKSSRLGDILKSFVIHDLTQNMRKEGDILDTIIKEMKDYELSDDNLVLLLDKAREYDRNTVPIGTLRVFPIAEHVTVYNEIAMRKSKYQKFILKAEDEFTTPSTVPLNRVLPQQIEKTAGIPEKLTVFVGARVMILRNIDIPKGLVYGRIATIRKIEQDPLMLESSLPTAIYLHLDGEKHWKTHKVHPGEFIFDSTYQKYRIRRRQYPFKLAFGCTIEETRGFTFDRVVLHLKHRFLDDSDVLQALGCVRYWDNLYIASIREKSLLEFQE